MRSAWPSARVRMRQLLVLATAISLFACGATAAAGPRAESAKVLKCGGKKRHTWERWDGRGHPDGLAGERIPLAARVISVADAFRTAPPGARFEELAGTSHDPHLVARLARLVREAEATAAA